MKPPLARNLAVRHTSFMCLTASFLATGGFVNFFHKITWFFHDYSSFFQIPWFFHAWNFFSWFSMFSRACGSFQYKREDIHNRSTYLTASLWETVLSGFVFKYSSNLISRWTLPCKTKIYSIIYEPVHEISNNMVCATSKASDQSAHTRSLIRAFASRLSILWLLSYWLNTI